MSAVSSAVVSQPVPRYLVRQPVGSEHDVDVVPGLRHDMVQSYDVVVSHQTATDLYTVVVATTPALSEHDRAVIAQALAATRRPKLVFLLEAAAGGGRAVCAPNVDASASAAAVAVVCTSTAWCDAEPLQVSVNSATFQVTAKWDGSNWQCGVAESG